MYAFPLTVNGTTVYVVPTTNIGQYRIHLAFTNADGWGYTYSPDAFIGYVHTVRQDGIRANTRWGYGTSVYTMDEAIAHILSDRTNWHCSHGDSSRHYSVSECDWCGAETERHALTDEQWSDGSPVITPVWAEGPMRQDGTF